eukprot:scaffold61381_cov33-Tisochrysis_lutea.AAC.2
MKFALRQNAMCQQPPKPPSSVGLAVRVMPTCHCAMVLATCTALGCLSSESEACTAHSHTTRSSSENMCVENMCIRSLSLSSTDTAQPQPQPYPLHSAYNTSEVAAD